MARRKKTDEERLAELLGITENVPDRRDSIERARKEEAKLAFIDQPKLFKMTLCKECRQPFAVSRENVAYCSGSCRRDALRKIGIVDFHPTYKDDADEVWTVWQNNEPLVVGPDDLEHIIYHFVQLRKQAGVEDEVYDLEPGMDVGETNGEE